MISPTALKKYGKDIMFHPVGTGPYKFVEWKQTDYLKGAKNENYWRPGLPKIDTITWVPVVDNNAPFRDDAYRRSPLHLPRAV